MGLSDSKEEPLPANSIINNQQPEWGTCYCGYSGAVTPSWNPCTINFALSSTEFTQQTINNEIQKINEKAVQFINGCGNSCRYCWWLGFGISCVIVFGGLSIIMVAVGPDYWFVIFALLGFSTLLVYIFQFAILYNYIKIWNKCLLNIEEYVVTELNEKYNQQNVYWGVRHKKLLHGCGRSSYRVKYIDIAVAPTAITRTASKRTTSPKGKKGNGETYNLI